MNSRKRRAIVNKLVFRSKELEKAMAKREVPNSEISHLLRELSEAVELLDRASYKRKLRRLIGFWGDTLIKRPRPARVA